MFTATIPANQVQIGDVINGKAVIKVRKDNKTRINIIFQDQRRGALVHHSKKFTITTNRVLSGTGFA